MYSKVLQITKKPQGVFECPFKVFVKGSRNHNSLNLKKKLIDYNSTNEFGQFTLESVEINIVKKSASDPETIKLWIIVVIAGLGGLCLLLAIVLIFQQVHVAFVH